ncbi:DUF6602 domain-containing protein [Lysinibacillus xylanilyticus]|uniref:DUF6602 domain-containing protein n=1 Tax=Lysinibacillus xylanilyticus TaxID=582475 RepID=UPI0038176523
MIREENKRLYLELMHGEFEKILSELDLVYKLSHNGEKGKEAEEIIKNFLKKYLPKNTSITTGFVQTELGISNQSDILLYDEVNYAPLYSGYANKIITFESLKANIECTTYLDSKKVQQDNTKCGNLKRLYNNDEKIQHRLLKKPFSILFAFKSKGNIKSILDGLEEKHVDMIFVADGQLYYLVEDEETKELKYTNNVVNQSMVGKTIHGYEYTERHRAFAFFYSRLVDLLNGQFSKPAEYSLIQRYSQSSVYIDFEKQD